MPEVLNVGVLGAGRWAKNAHIPGWQRDPRVRVLAVCDPQLELAKEAGKEFKIPTITSNHREVIERKDIQVIDVCTSSATHFQLTTEALEAGKHVLCEKPVGHDYQQTIQARDLAQKKGLKT